ncbi:MAG: MASE3 domain-containing protein [Sedimentisphaerales bacterium]
MLLFCSYAVVIVGLYIAKLHSYILFHSLVEIFSVSVAFAIFMVVWNSRQFISNNYLIFLGISFLFVGIIDLLHTLAYKGMGIFQGYGTNLATQLWISARYMESISLVAALFFLKRRLNVGLMLLIYGSVLVILILSIFFWGIFPVCYNEQTGLTPFKDISEFIISGILLVSLVLMLNKRDKFDPKIMRFIFWAIILTMASELMFTLYVNPYEATNMIGHYLKLVAFYLIYKALIETGLRKRAQTITASGSWQYDVRDNKLTMSEEAYRIFGLSVNNPIALSNFFSFVHSDDRDLVDKEWETAAKTKRFDIEHRIVVNGQNKWIRQNAEMEYDETGQLKGGFGAVIDITEQKRKEEELKRLNRTLRALSKSTLAVAHAADELRYLQNVCDIIINDCGHAMVWIGFAENDEAKTVKPIVCAGFEEGYLDTLRITWADAPRGRGPTGTAIRTRKASVCKNIPTNPAFEPWRADAVKRGYASAISLPLLNDGKAFGALTIYSREVDPFTKDEVNLLTELVGDLSLGISTIRLRKARDEAEASLRQNEATLRGILDATKESIWLFSTDGVVVTSNPTALSRFKNTADEIIGKHISDFLPPELAKSRLARLREVIESGRPLEFEDTRDDIVFRNSFYPVQDSEGRVTSVVSFSRDITERKKVEEVLQRQAQLLRLSYDAIIVWRKDSGIEYWNRGAEQLYGFTETEVLGRVTHKLLKTIHPMPWPKIEAEIRNHGQWEGELRHHAKDGHEVIVSAQHQLVLGTDGIERVLETNRDITGRKQAEEALQESERNYRELVQNANSAIIRWNRDGNITLFNEYAEHFFGYSSEEVIGRKATFLLPDGDTSETNSSELIHNILNDPEHYVSNVNENICRDGRRVWMAWTNKPVYDGDGQVSEILAVGTDITKQKKAEEEIQKARDELEIRVRERTLKLQETNEQLKEEIEERLRTEQSLRWEEARLDALVSLSEISEAPLDKITNFTLEQAIALTHSKIGFIGFLNEDETMYELHSVSKDVVKACNVEGDPLHWPVADAGIWADAVRQRKTLFVNDYSKPHPRKKGTPKGHVPMERLMVVPVFEGDKIVTIAGVGNKDSDYENTDERQVVLLLSAMWNYVQKKHSREMALAERQRFNDVLETLPVYVCLLTPDYYMPFANKVFRDLFGYYPDKKCYEFLFDRKEPCENCETYKVLENGNPQHWEWTGPNGRNYDIFDFPFKDTDGSQLILEMGIDITDRKKAQEELRAASLYSRSLLEASLDPLVTISAEGKITDVNEATVQVTGSSRMELIGTDFSNYFTEPDKAREGYQKVFAQGFVTDYPLTIQNHNGKLIDVLYNATVYKNEEGEVQGIFAAARDVTEKKQTERRQGATNALLELYARKTSRKEYLVSAVDVIRDWSGCSRVGIRIKDSEDNIPYESSVGFEKNFIEMENPLHLGNDSCLCIRAILQNPKESDKVLLTPDGSFYSNDSLAFLRNLSPMKAKDYRGQCMKHGFQSIGIIPIRYRDDVVGAIHIADSQKDMVPLANVQFIESTIAPLIGEAINRFNAEAELEKYHLHLEEIVKQRTEELARSNKDLEQFAYVASHDLQEPLRAVAGFVGLLQRQITDSLNDKTKEYMDFTINGVHRMQALINGLLEYSRIDTRGKPPVEIDSSEPLEDAVLALHTSIGETGAKITSDKLPTVNIDPIQLTQLFQNLISNAIKFKSEKPPEIHISATRQDNAWQFAVKDNGIGIERQYADRIFMIFQRLHTRKQYPGTGIGLSLCKKIVERHGGKIWFESEPGKGSTFYFTIPDLEGQN